MSTHRWQHPPRRPLRIWGFLTLVALLAVSPLAVSPLAAQKTVEEASTHGPLEDYIPYRTHQSQHDIYNPLIGEWGCDMSVLLHGTPPPQGTLRVTFKADWIFDGRYLEMNIRRVGVSEHFGKEPVDVEDIQYFGYDPIHKKYYNILLTEEHVVPTSSEGEYDAETHTLTFTGIEEDPITEDSFTKWEVFHLGGKDGIPYELHYSFLDGSKIKVGWCTFEKKK